MKSLQQPIYLDGLRGWASLIILNWHFHATTNVASTSHFVNFIFLDWRSAFSLLFVLSGRMIALSILRTPTPQNCNAVVVNRSCRIFALLCGAFFFNWLMQVVGAFNLPKDAKIQDIVQGQAYAYDGLKQPYNLWDIIPRTWGILIGANRTTSDKSILHGLSVCWTLVNEIDCTFWLSILALVIGKASKISRLLGFLLYVPALYLTLKINSIVSHE